MTDNLPNADSIDVLEQFDWNGKERPSETVVRAVAATEDCDPLEVDPLQESIDTDALDALVTSDGDGAHDVTVTFPYEGYGILVESSGLVEVYAEPFVTN